MASQDQLFTGEATMHFKHITILFITISFTDMYKESVTMKKKPVQTKRKSIKRFI